MLQNKKIIKFLLALFLFLSPCIVFALQDAAQENNMTQRMMMLAIQLGIIFFLAKIGGILFTKINIPAVLGEVATGMIIGPFALGGIPFPGFTQGFIPSFTNFFPVSPELYGFATVAAILLLFNVGLETDLNLVKKFYRAGAAVAIGGVLFSFVFGVVTMTLFSRWLFGNPINYLHPSALFLGAISSATSVGITARILSDRQKIGSPEGVTILAGAVIDDVLGIIVLAIILGLIKVLQAGGLIDWFKIGIIAVKAIGIWLIATFIGLAVANRISILLKLLKGKTEIALMALSLALILAGLFEEAGLAMIIGAYIMGLSLSKTDIGFIIQERLHAIYELLVPIFFCVMGMLVDFKAIISVPVLLFGFIYSLSAVLAKLLGSGIPSLFFNFNLRGAARIGIGMVPRGEVALIMAGVGLASGAFEQKIFGIAILMIVLTTVIAPIILVNLFRNPLPGTRKKIPVGKLRKLSFPFPTEDITELLTNKLLKIFESEKFFVSLIDIENRHYQMRKENIVINFYHQSQELIFYCQHSEVILINAVLFEALAEFDKTVKMLQKPLDKDTITVNLQSEMDLDKVKFNLSKYLTPDNVKIELKGNNKDEIIRELLTLLEQNGNISDYNKAWSAIWEREKSISTGMKFGIAIPHAKTDIVSDIICAVGIKPDGVDFDSIDNIPAQIFVIILIPETATSPYLQLLSKIIRFLSNPDVRDNILSCKSKEQLYRLFTQIS
jgi:Kef-type K+ transport system membrane component KefB/mannitol/fructose-specific phosphotransferase system IIA component (Ntr-type)